MRAPTQGLCKGCSCAGERSHRTGSYRVGHTQVKACGRDVVSPPHITISRMDRIVCWLQSSLQRIFPSTPAPVPQATPAIDLIAARNERVSFQACVQNLGFDAAEVKVSVLDSPGLDITVRRVGYVPMAHHNTGTPAEELDGRGCIPGMVPDPLLPGNVTVLGPVESQSFWVTVNITAETEPGIYELAVRFEQQSITIAQLTVPLAVRSPVVQERRDFPVTHWFYADALCDWYNVEPFDKKFWALAEPYLANLGSHGIDCRYVPIFTPPTDGVKRPTQLLKISEPMRGQYWFDFSEVRHWTRLAQQHGARTFEWTHLFTQWGARYAIRVYRNTRNADSLLWPPETEATSRVYRNFLEQFLPAFHTFLQLEGLEDKSIYHVSDEPGEQHLPGYRAARAMLQDLAPWMKVADALSDVEFGREGLTDIPIPSISTAHAYAEANLPAWVYFCCGPRGQFLNRLMDTPLAKIRLSGWLFYRLHARGFLHWGYNYWYKSQTQELIDPFTEQSGMAWPGWAYGDPFVVYPGDDGPLDSIRWEVFAESLRDYALLQTLGISPDDASLDELKGYDEFPKGEQWVAQTRRSLLDRVTR